MNQGVSGSSAWLAVCVVAAQSAYVVCLQPVLQGAHRLALSETQIQSIVFAWLIFSTALDRIMWVENFFL